MRLSHYSVLDRGWAKTGKVLTPQYLREKATHAEQSRVNGESDAMKDGGGVCNLSITVVNSVTKSLNHSIYILFLIFFVFVFVLSLSYRELLLTVPVGYMRHLI